MFEQTRRQRGGNGLEEKNRIINFSFERVEDDDDDDSTCLTPTTTAAAYASATTAMKMYNNNNNNNNNNPWFVKMEAAETPTTTAVINKKKNNNNVDGSVAPFVLKTYDMVSDPATDHLISWGPANNTFVVFDPLPFSAFLLPCRFKHNNFSSFVRQLNTYGFRKVDPDRWEFANEWFLRGQNHLLRNIVRRKHSAAGVLSHHHHHHRPLFRRPKPKQELGEQEDDDDEEEEEMNIRTEIRKLKMEQIELEKEIDGMSKRIQATERRPDQVMAFLRRVADDPGILPRLAVERDRRRLQHQHQQTFSSSCSGEEEEDDELEDHQKRRRLALAFASSTTSGSSSGTGTGIGTGTGVLFPGRTDEDEAATSNIRSINSVWDAVGGRSTVAGDVAFLFDSPSDVDGTTTPYPFCLLG